ncbi:MAG: radical SAM protein [Myxococcota bacterium]
MKRQLSAFEYLREKARKTDTLLSLHFDITYRCPLRCIHCYIDHRRMQELSLNEIDRILHNARTLNVLFVTYSGGEVFLRKDFEKILRITKRLGFSIKIITSGYLIKEREVEILRENDVLNVGVSLYSLDPSIHDSITQVRGSFEKTMNAIELLYRNNINIIIKTSIMRGNYSNYIDILKWTKKFNGKIIAQYDMVITPTMSKRGGVRELNIPFEEKKRLFKEIGRIEKIKEVKIDEMESERQASINKDAVTCYAGITGLYIAPDGKLFPCVEWNELLGDLRRESLIDIWRNSEKLRWIKSLRITDYKQCFSCKYLGVCSICPGLNLRDTDNIFKPSELACQRARMYYEN